MTGKLGKKILIKQITVTYGNTWFSFYIWKLNVQIVPLVFSSRDAPEIQPKNQYPVQP